jgi:DNA-binding transcriptional LysR family regulator
MNLKNFDLNLLRSLEALLTERSVTRAADRVCVSQPTMSGSLQRLRDYFEDQLLIRVGREMELTPLAKSLVGGVRDVLHSIQTTLEIKPSFDPGTARRTFTVSISDYATVILMPFVLKRLAEQAPYISCVIEPLTEAYVDRLASGESDFYIAAGNWRLFGAREPGVEIKTEPLFADTFVCMVDKSHPSIGEQISLEDYKRLPHLLVRLAPGVESMIEHAWKLSELDLKVTATLGGFFTSIFLLLGTPLIATTQRRLAQLLAAILPLKILRCPVEIPTLHESLSWHVRHEFDPGHQYMRRVFAEAAAPLRLSWGEGSVAR